MSVDLRVWCGSDSRRIAAVFGRQIESGVPLRPELWPRRRDLRAAERYCCSVSIDVVAIVTCDRPARVIDCLAGYAANCRRYERRPELLVVDDSKSPDAEHRVRPSLVKLAREHALAVRYASASDRRRFADVLAAESGVPVEIVRFALLGDSRCELSVGANRNGLLLDTIGGCVFSADDDTSCRLAAAPDAGEHLTFMPSGDPTEFWFYPDQSAAVDALADTDADLLAPHERLLGRSTDGPAAGAPVALTMNGLAGDSGMASPRYYLSLTDPSRARLVASEEAYRGGFTSRGVIRTVRQPTICAESFVMTTFFGFDNRELLPPFVPVQRNSDGVLGVMLPRCIAGSRVAFVPWTLRHLPVEPRGYSTEDLWIGAEHVRFSDVVIDGILAHSAVAAPSRSAAITQLGAHLRQLGELPLGAFETHVRSVQGFRTAAFTTLLSQRLLTYRDMPPYWASDVRRVIERMDKARLSETLVVPRDLRAQHDTETARRLSQDLVAMFGRLLEAWPAIVDASARLRAAGIRLSRLLGDGD